MHDEYEMFTAAEKAEHNQLKDAAKKRDIAAVETRDGNVADDNDQTNSLNPNLARQTRVEMKPEWSILDLSVAKTMCNGAGKDIRQILSSTLHQSA